MPKQTFKPVVGLAPAKSPTPVVGPVPSERRFVFSFRFFRQNIRYFGLGSLDSAWFTSWLDKMSELSHKDYSSLMSNMREKQSWRLHEINWDGKNVPVARESLTWIDKNYLHNSEEFPFFQFQITKAFGRVIGFWDETGTFNVVFLDSMHNMQPSSYSDYKLRETTIAGTEFPTAIQIIENAVGSCGHECQCKGLYGKLQSGLTHGLPFETMLIPMEQQLFTRVAKCVEDNLAQCVSDILDVGLKSLDY